MKISEKGFVKFVNNLLFLVFIKIFLKDWQHVETITGLAKIGSTTYTSDKTGWKDAMGQSDSYYEDFCCWTIWFVLHV